MICYILTNIFRLFVADSRCYQPHCFWHIIWRQVHGVKTAVVEFLSSQGFCPRVSAETATRARVCTEAVFCNSICNVPFGAGHAVYNKVRNVAEMVLKTRGSVDLVALGDFLDNVEDVPVH